MIKIYGIKNCDTMKKAFTWLDQHKVKYEFHDYKKEGVTKAVIESWLEQHPIEQVINMKGTTWKNLSEEQKTFIKNKSKAIALMMEQPSMIKRPMVETGKKVILGFNPEAWTKEIS